jgi:uncharacterized protein (TIGR00369 family)
MEQGQVLLGFLEGRIPYGPDAKILGARILEAVPGSGQVTIEFDGTNFPTHILGNVTGGFIAAMLDLIASYAPATTFEPKEFGPTLELKVNFLRAANVGKFRGVGRTVHRTKSIAFTEAELRNESGELVATASSTLRLIRT